MAESSIVRTSIKVTTDATDARSGLEKLGGEIKQWAAKQQNALGGQFAAALRGGLVGGLIGGSLQGIVEDLVVSMKNWALGTKETAKAHEALVASLRAAGAAQEKNLKSAADWRTTMVESGDRVASINRDLDEQSGRWNAIDATVKKLMKSMADRAAAGLMNPFRRELQDREAGEINARVAEMDKIAGEIAKLSSERESILDPTKNLALAQGIAKATLALKDQVTAWGLTGDAAERARFKAAGATDAMLKDFDKAADAAAARERLGLDRSTNPLLGEIARVMRDPRRFDRMEFLERSGSASFGKLGSLLAMGMNAAGGALAPAMKPGGAVSLDNAALVKGTAAEVSARTRSEFGGSIKQQLDEAKKANAHLAEIADGVKSLTFLPGVGLIPM